jgi:hypothetical protein
VQITSTPIGARYLAGQAFFNFLMPRCLPWLKRGIFGERKSDASGAAQARQPDIPAPAAGRLSDKGLRARLISIAFTSFHVLLLPITWPIALGYRLAGFGHTLYALASVPVRN